MFNNTVIKNNLQDVPPGNVSQGGPREGGFPAKSLPDGGLLGSTYKIGFKKAENKVMRYVLQHAAGEILPDERVHWCNRRTLPKKEFVGISYSESTKRAHYNNLMRCCQIWICPVCAQKVIFERKKEIQYGIAKFRAAGGHAYMVTATLQHSLQDPLQRVLDDLLISVRKTLAGGWWQEIKRDLRIVGMISALEPRWGDMNGWHPHKHILFLCKKELLASDQQQLTTELTRRYCDQLSKRGAYANPDIGLVLTEDKDDGGYLAKWGIDDELSKGAIKTGRPGSKSPFDLLLWSLTGSAQPGQLFKEYWKNFKGHRQLVFHKGTRKLLGLGTMESDAVLLDLAPDDDELLYQVGLDLWNKICRLRVRGELLEAAENGGLMGIEAYLRGLYEN